MDKQNKATIQTREEYIHGMHKFGRCIAIMTIIVMMAIPTIAMLYFNAIPDWMVVATTAAGLLAIFIPTNIGEVVSYTPILGSSIYLTFITGNLMNLKVPVATSAMDMMDAPYGSEEADVFGSIAVGISSFVTIIIVALGVVLMIPLQPVLALPVVKTATAYVIPALFGTLLLAQASPNLGGGLTSPNRLKGAVLPVILVTAVAGLDKYVLKLGIMSRYQGVVVIALLLMLYFGTKKLYEKGKIQVYLPGEKPAE